MKEKTLREQREAVHAFASNDPSTLSNHAKFYHDATNNVLGFMEAQKIQRGQLITCLDILILV